MQRKKIFLMLISFGALLAAVSGIALASVRPAYAQCGSQASSCKNCHEVQGQDPVNADGTGWHQSHAFGDFCYICHGGNNQATDKAAAHTAMVSPLADVKTSCQQCHPNDLETRAQVYASALGVEAGLGGGEAKGPAPTEPAVATEPAEAAATEPALASVSPDDPNLVDYVERYNQNVLGEQPANWGNIILIVILAALLIGGAVFIANREGWVRISFKELKPLEKEYTADVVELTNQIAQLKPPARQSLKNLLAKPRAAAILKAADELTSDEPTKNNQ